MTHNRARSMLLLVPFLLVFALSCNSKKKSASPAASHRITAPSHSQPPASAESYTIVTAHHVVFHEKSGLHLRAEWLQGRLYPTRSGVTPSLDDSSSFKIDVEEGRTEIRLDELSAILRKGAFRDSKLSNVRLTAKGSDQVQVRATYHELIPLPVDLAGKVTATPDGRIEIQVRKLTVLKLPFRSMLRLLHFDRAQGIEAANGKIFLRTDQLLPPPHKLGHLTAVHFTRDGRLEEDYGRRRAEEPELADWNRGQWPNYIRLTGGTIRFGRLTMKDADIVLLDTSPGDWFVFDLGRYPQQITAGEMRMTSSGGLRIFIPDSSKLHAE